MGVPRRHGGSIKNCNLIAAMRPYVPKQIGRPIAWLVSILVAVGLSGCETRPTPPTLPPQLPSFASLEGCHLRYPDGSPIDCLDHAVKAEKGPTGNTICWIESNSALDRQKRDFRYRLEVDPVSRRLVFHTLLADGMKAVAVFGQEDNWTVIHHEAGEWHSTFEQRVFGPLDLIQENIIIFQENSSLVVDNRSVATETRWSHFEGEPWAVYVAFAPSLHSVHSATNITFMGEAHPVGYLSLDVRGSDFEWRVNRTLLWQESGNVGGYKPCNPL